MKRLIALWAALISVLAISTTGLAQPKFEFNLGFKALADQVLDVVGQPLENEHYGLNGDSQQQTTTGLMVWRKADNWTAFTNGYMTWINGPYGVQSRLNDQRFDWERESQPYSPPQTNLTQSTPPCVIGGDDVKLTFAKKIDGLWWGSGMIRNSCSQAMDAEVDVAGLADRDGKLPIMDANTAFVVDLAPGATRSIAVRIPTGQAIPWFRTTFTSRPVDERQTFQINLGTTKPLRVDPWMEGAVWALWEHPQGQWLLKVAAENGVLIRRGATEDRILGTYDPSTRSIVISDRLDGNSRWARAAVLAHELQHAADFASGKVMPTKSACYQGEVEAFRREASVWAEFWASRLPANVDPAHAELNDITLSISRDPATFAKELEDRYYGQCSKLPE